MEQVSPSQPLAVIVWEGQFRDGTGASGIPIQKGPGLSAQLNAFPASILTLAWTVTEESREGKRTAKVTQHRVRSQKQQSRPSNSLSLPHGKTPWWPCTVFPEGYLCGHGDSVQEKLMRVGGLCPKGEGRVCLKPVWPGALLTALSMNNSICPTVWSDAQRWGGGKIMNKESILTKDPAIGAQLKEILKDHVFKRCLPTGEFF